MKHSRLVTAGAVAVAILVAVVMLANASSHREAPFITELPKVDGTDFYMFRSYEPERQNFVTIVANYLPLQDAYGGPNYFALDPDALYEIHIDNDGDAQEELTFQFRFQTNLRGLTLSVGEGSNVATVAVPLINIGALGLGGNPANTGALNVTETYTVTLVRGDRRSANRRSVTNARATSAVAEGATTFVKPVDNIGQKSLPQYAAYANAHIYDINIPGCDVAGSRMFVGQRRDPFVVNLGEVFDLVNVTLPAVELGENAERAGTNILADKNVTSLILEVPIACLTTEDEPVIGGWTTASLRQGRALNRSPSATQQPAAIEGGAWTQVSRLGFPLVNEVFIGLPDKDRFNASKPQDDAQFVTYVTNPTLPELLEILFFDAAGVQAPNLFPRQDLVAAVLTGIPAAVLQPLSLEAAANQPQNVVPAEMLRLNTSTTPAPAEAQSRLGVIGGDVAGFPNGRRPGDDVVDIELRVAMGVVIALDLLPGVDPALAPSGLLQFTDGAFVDASRFPASFPYLEMPLPGSPATASEGQ